MSDSEPSDTVADTLYVAVALVRVPEINPVELLIDKPGGSPVAL